MKPGLFMEAGVMLLKPNQVILKLILPDLQGEEAATGAAPGRAWRLRT